MTRTMSWALERSTSRTTRPSVLFADEPTGNLDSATSAEILEVLRKAVEGYGQTTIMVTHDAKAAAIADRILFLADGLIVDELSRSASSTSAGVERPSSFTMRPSARNRMRSAIAAAFASWVTMIVVWP